MATLKVQVDTDAVLSRRLTLNGLLLLHNSTTTALAVTSNKCWARSLPLMYIGHNNWDINNGALLSLLHVSLASWVLSSLRLYHSCFASA